MARVEAWALGVVVLGGETGQKRLGVVGQNHGRFRGRSGPGGDGGDRLLGAAVGRQPRSLGFGGSERPACGGACVPLQRQARLHERDGDGVADASLGTLTPQQRVEVDSELPVVGRSAPADERLQGRCPVGLLPGLADDLVEPRERLGGPGEVARGGDRRRPDHRSVQAEDLAVVGCLDRAAIEYLYRDPSWACFMCISGEHADALIDDGRPTDALAFVATQRAAARAAGREASVARLADDEADALIALGRAAEEDRWSDLVDGLREEGWYVDQQSSEEYGLEVDGEERPALYAFLAVPAQTADAEAHAALERLVGDPEAAGLVWTALVRAAGDTEAAEAHQARSDRLGIVP